MVDDVIEGFEDPVREPIVAHELPDVLLRVQFRTLRGQRDQGDIVGDVQAGREMPSGLIDEKRRMRAWRDLLGDFGQMEGHRFGVAAWHDERRALAVLRTDRPEDIGGDGSLVFRRARARAAFGPTSGDLVLLPHARFVGEPDLYGVGLDALFAPDFFQAGG